MIRKEDVKRSTACVDETKLYCTQATFRINCGAHSAAVIIHGRIKLDAIRIALDFINPAELWSRRGFLWYSGQQKQAIPSLLERKWRKCRLIDLRVLCPWLYDCWNLSCVMVLCNGSYNHRRHPRASCACAERAIALQDRIQVTKRYFN